MSCTDVGALRPPFPKAATMSTQEALQRRAVAAQLSTGRCSALASQQDLPAALSTSGKAQVGSAVEQSAVCWRQHPCVLIACCLSSPGAPTRAQPASQEQLDLLQGSLKSTHPSKTTGTPSAVTSHQHDANPALPLQVLSEKLDVLRLAFYTAPVSCGVLLPVFFLREVGARMPTARSQQAAVPCLSERSCCRGAVMPCGKMLLL